MLKLEYSGSLKRKIRKDDVSELSVTSWQRAKEAVEDSRTAEALELIDYAAFEDKQIHDILAGFPDAALSYIAEKLGEDAVADVLRERYYERAKQFTATITDPKEAMLRMVEQQRGHSSRFTVTEEADRYVVSADPCGSGGLQRRLKNVGCTKEPHYWSWGKKGIPYYCCHCCMYMEILPSEISGYPVRIHELTADPADPCVMYYYKNPELIPKEYLGRIKPPK